MSKKLKNTLDLEVQQELKSLVNQNTELKFQEYFGAPIFITKILPAFQNSSKVAKDVNKKKYYKELCAALEDYGKSVEIFVAITEQLEELRNLCKEVGL